jgi:predicted O-methyltransferase YrrM
MSISLWREVDRYISGALIHPDAAFEAALQESDRAGLPPIAVSPTQGKLLELFARSVNAHAILEIGTLGGYSTIWLARGLAEAGCLVTLEINPAYAEIARVNIARAGYSDRVDVKVGPAIEALPKLEGPFDLTFIDADKKGNADYFAWALRLSRPGSLIIVDNVVRNGAVLDAESHDANVQGVRRLFDRIAAESRVAATAIQTVGEKGHDGFLLALVTGAP